MNNILNPEVRFRLVAQWLCFGEHLDELFVGPLRLTRVNLLLSVAEEKYQSLMLLGAKCACLHGSMRRNGYIELPRHDPRHSEGQTIGNLRKAMYATGGAPQIWADTIREKMLGS